MSAAASDGFTLHPEAARDLTQLWEYLANINPAAAGRVRAEILEAIRAAVPYPHRGHRRPDLTSRPLRFLVVRDYLIAYAPDTRPLVVLAVLHGRRNPRTLAAILGGRQEPRSTGGA
jgi:plasmid stabilization system protein ParE